MMTSKIKIGVLEHSTHENATKSVLLAHGICLHILLIYKYNVRRENTAPLQIWTCVYEIVIATFIVLITIYFELGFPVQTAIVNTSAQSLAQIDMRCFVSVYTHNTIHMYLTPNWPVLFHMHRDVDIVCIFFFTKSVSFFLYLSMHLHIRWR